MKIHQISLFVENKPGHIAAPARLLAQEGVDIRALYLADTAAIRHSADDCLGLGEGCTRLLKPMDSW